MARVALYIVSPDRLCRWLCVIVWLAVCVPVACRISGESLAIVFAVADEIGESGIAGKYRLG